MLRTYVAYLCRAFPTEMFRASNARLTVTAKTDVVVVRAIENKVELPAATKRNDLPKCEEDMYAMLFGRDAKEAKGLDRLEGCTHVDGKERMPKPCTMHLRRKAGVEPPQQSPAEQSPAEQSKPEQSEPQQSEPRCVFAGDKAYDCEYVHELKRAIFVDLAECVDPDAKIDVLRNNQPLGDMDALKSGEKVEFKVRSP